MKNNSKKKNNKKSEKYTSDEILQMINDTSLMIAEDNSIRLSAVSSSVNESNLLTDNVEFWRWMDRNYMKSGHFSSAENLQTWISESANHEQWTRNIIQGKGFEWDWMSSQRQVFSNIFKTFTAGDQANRIGSDVTARDLISRSEMEVQLKAYTSSNIPDLKNTPKTMTVVTNEEKVALVKNKGYEKTIEFGNNESIKKSTENRMEQARNGTIQTTYTLKNVGNASAKAGVMGFILCATKEMIANYRRFKNGKMSREEYLKEIFSSSADSALTSSFSTAIMVPVSATITAAGASSIISFPISFVVSSSVNKIIAPAFHRGEYSKILAEATFYKQIDSFCYGLVDSIENATIEYEIFLQDMALQTQTFFSMRNQIPNQQIIEDIDYLSSLPKEKAEVAIAGMLSLLQDTDQMSSALENQNFIQRMFMTVLGKNKATKDEIRKNHDKLTVYISEALTALFDRQVVDERIFRILGQEIIELCSDNAKLIQILHTLDNKVDSINNSSLLREEISKGIYDYESPIVSMCEIIPLIDQRMFYSKREKRVLGIELNKKNIISNIPMSLYDFAKLITKIETKNIGLVYTFAISIRSNEYARIIISIIENGFFLVDGSPEIMNSAIDNSLKNYDKKENLTLNILFDSFLNSWIETISSKHAETYAIETHFDYSLESQKISMQKAETYFWDGKLIDAYQLFLDAANKDNPRAFYYLSLYYTEGFGHIEPDYEKAKEYLKCGMELKEPLCTYKYGTLEYEESDSQLHKWIDKYIPAIRRLVKLNDPIAMYEYGWYFAFVYSNDPNKCITALNYFEKSASMGYWPGALRFFQLTEDLRKEGIKLPDYSYLFENVEWFFVQSLLGVYYSFYDEDSNYYELGAKHFQKSLQLVEKDNIAAGYLAFLLNTGLVADSLSNGYSSGSIPMYYEAGLKSNSPLQLFDLGRFYLTGIGPNERGKDLDKAYEHLYKSYKIKKTKYSSYLLGLLKFDQNDDISAIQYLTESVKMGEKQALIPLSYYYETGTIVTKDTERAKWMREQGEISQSNFDTLQYSLEMLKEFGISL